MRLVWVFLALVIAGCTPTPSEDSVQQLPEPPVPPEVPDMPEQSQDAPEVIPEVSAMAITSTAFQNNTGIPDKYSCYGSNLNPVIAIRGIPDGAETLALIVDDPDAGGFVHWVMWNMPLLNVISEDSAPGEKGVNSAGTMSYYGPCPTTTTHRYFFKVYALNTHLNLGDGSSKSQLLNAMEGHVVGYGELVGRYTRH